MFAHRILCGRTAILEERELLETYAAQCGLPHALHWLPYFLSGRGRMWKTPSVVLVFKNREPEGRLAPGDLAGAALFFEYSPLGLLTGSLIADEVVALPRDRARIAALAANAMMRAGGHSLAVLYQGEASEGEQAGKHLQGRGMQWALTAREQKQSISLAPTLDETLAQMGKRARRNLRYYRKRFDEQYCPEFLPDAHRSFSEQDMLELNARSRNPVPVSEVRHRYAASVVRPGFLGALRARDGRWLSAVGGWRCNGTTVLFWQANVDEYERDSLVTVMRAYLLEDEVRRGTERLTHYGGTMHPMRSAFDDEVKWALIVRRRSHRARLLRVAGRLVEKNNIFTGRANMLAGYLRNPTLTWQDARQALESATAQDEFRDFATAGRRDGASPPAWTLP